MEADRLLLETLGDAQRFGFLGAAPIADMVAHAEQYLAAVPPGLHRVVDVGAGGGLPGLVLARQRPDTEFVLIDRRTRRTDFLHRAVTRLGLTGQVVVVPGDAGDLARRPAFREQFDGAVARGLGAPALTAELCRGFVRAEGILVVSEPPASGDGPTWPDRWPAEGLAELGWAPDQVFPGVVRLRAVGPPPVGIPRRGRLAPHW